MSLQLQSIIGSDPPDLSYSEQIINVHAVGFAHLVDVYKRQIQRGAPITYALSWLIRQMGLAFALLQAVHQRPCPLRTLHSLSLIHI